MKGQNHQNKQLDVHGTGIAICKVIMTVEAYLVLAIFW